jgi:hypothetical protein
VFLLEINVAPSIGRVCVPGSILPTLAILLDELEDNKLNSVELEGTSEPILELKLAIMDDNCVPADILTSSDEIIALANPKLVESNDAIIASTLPCAFDLTADTKEEKSPFVVEESKLAAENA